MKKTAAAITIFALSIACILFLSSDSTAQTSSCMTLKFPILSTTTGLQIGDIKTEVVVNGAEDEKVCLKGTYMGKRYQYIYRCSTSGDWTFVEKLKKHTGNCIWGKIS